MGKALFCWVLGISFGLAEAIYIDIDIDICILITLEGRGDTTES